MKRTGFTLIELLVVIAIIAILAAILFPVFAQAKMAAKGAVAISGAKQLSLGQLMYSTDSDDFFPLTVATVPNGWGAEPWEFLDQPYMKSWDLLIDPTGPISIDNLNSANGGSGWQLYGLWGMPPERISSRLTKSASDFTFGQQALGAQMTGGALWYYDGIGGAGIGPDWAQTWPVYDYAIGGTPSLSTTAVARPSDQVMIAQSATYDFMWENVGYGDLGDGNDSPDNFDIYFSACGDNTYGCNVPICGPIARKRDSDGPTVGFIPNGFNGTSFTAQATQLPTGITIWAGTDGHVVATPWRQLMGTTIPINGNQLAIKAFWPTN